MRAVFETLGIGDVVAKSLGSRNPHNMVKATFAGFVNAARALGSVATRRGKKVSDLLGKKRHRRRAWWRSAAMSEEPKHDAVTKHVHSDRDADRLRPRPQAGSKGDADRTGAEQAAASTRKLEDTPFACAA